jgi:hypothetical protein
MNKLLALALLSLASVAAAQPLESDAPVEHGRVRWGVNARAGAFLPYTSVIVGLEGRAGYQFSSAFALYGDFGVVGGLGVGANITASGGSGTLNLASWWHLGVNAELTLFDHLYLAAGPHLVSAAFGSATGSGSSAGGSGTVGGAVGLMPALDVRLGFMTGATRPDGRRRGFSIGADLMVLFASTARVSGSGSAQGFNAEVTRDSVTGFAPTLTLGYDAL